jgi:surface antigen
MRTIKTVAILTAALMAVGALQPVLGQGRFGRGPGGPNSNGYDEGYRDAYREAYRNGYDDGRRGRRFDDRIVSRANDRDERWRRRYTRVYTYNDDVFYRECRTSVDPAGILAGAFIGGLVGNIASGGRGGATVAGIVLGGATGAALTRDMDCEDRSYAYKAYYDGFNSNRPNSTWNWRNPRNGHSGDFRVGEYYSDDDGFRCSTYSQRIFVNGRPQTASGRACQQPDGSWSIVG